jgi:hypothetical protein
VDEEEQGARVGRAPPLLIGSPPSRSARAPAPSAA